MTIMQIKHPNNLTWYQASILMGFNNSELIFLLVDDGSALPLNDISDY